ncbi:MAG: hypothetical protein WC299_06980 [Kiritimatiellia bacterium]
MELHKTRFKGPRWELAYGSYDGVERFALGELNAAAQRCLPYVIRCAPAAGSPPGKENMILFGTAANNPLIAELTSRKLIAIPAKPQSYAIAGMASPWAPGRRVLAVAGSDPAGALYGAVDFCARFAPAATGTNPLESSADFTASEGPLVENRGIWTWGYVVYDYRRFIDNMARLKLNMLTIWNDCPPLNIAEIIPYARARGIKIILGFHWGWGLILDLSRAADREAIRKAVLDEYEKNYSRLDFDGIYFQTVTEHNDTEAGGKSLAAIVCAMVNDIAGALLERRPGLHIQFGLHATSIRENYTDLSALDPGITIVWENNGAIPFCYTVEPEYATAPEGYRTFAQTLAYCRKLATFRPGAPFGIVPKGWINIDWSNEFEHHGPFLMGERHRRYISERLAQRQPHWDKVNELWRKNNALAAEFYREMLKLSPKGMIVTALVEDGMFEERVQPSVGLFAETVWNPERDPDLILQLGENLAAEANRKL